MSSKISLFLVFVYITFQCALSATGGVMYPEVQSPLEYNLETNTLHTLPLQDNTFDAIIANAQGTAIINQNSISGCTLSPWVIELKNYPISPLSQQENTGDIIFYTHGDYIYVLDAPSSLKILKIYWNEDEDGHKVSPAKIDLLKTVNFESENVVFNKVHRILYYEPKKHLVVAGYPKIHFIDISNPEVPIHVTKDYNTPSSIAECQLYDNKLYIAYEDEDYGLQVIDLTANPLAVVHSFTSMDIQGDSLKLVDMTVNNDFVLVIDSETRNFYSLNRDSLTINQTFELAGPQASLVATTAKNFYLYYSQGTASEIKEYFTVQNHYQLNRRYPADKKVKSIHTRSNYFYTLQPDYLVFYRFGVPLAYFSNDKTERLHQEIYLPKVKQAEPLYHDDLSSNWLLVAYPDKVVLTNIVLKGAELSCLPDSSRSKSPITAKMTFYSHSCPSKKDGNPNSICQISREVKLTFYSSFLAGTGKGLWIGLSIGGVITIIGAAIFYTQYRKLNHKYDQLREELHLKHVKYLSGSERGGFGGRRDSLQEKFNELDSEAPSRFHEDIELIKGEKRKNSDGSSDDGKPSTLLPKPKSKFLQERDAERQPDSPTIDFHTSDKLKANQDEDPEDKL